MSRFLLPIWVLLFLHIRGSYSSITIDVHTNDISESQLPSILCYPDPNTGTCFFLNFQHNNSDVNTALEKYTSFNTSNNARLQFNSVVPSDSGSYRCCYTCSGVTTYSATEVFTYIPPVIFMTPNNVSYYVYVGDNVTLFCNVLHYENFQWRDAANDLIISDDTFQIQGTNLSVFDVKLGNAGIYRCSVSSRVSPVLEIIATLRVYMKPYIQVSSNKTIRVPEGSSVSLYCKAVGAPRPTVVWGNDHSLTIGGRISQIENNINQYTINSSLHISNAIMSDSGNYKCTAATDNGTTTETFQLTVYVHMPDTPRLQVTSLVINSTSVEVSWTAFNIPQEAHVMIHWSIHNIANSESFTVTLSQNTSSFIITNLLPNTSYIFNVTVAGILSMNIITTHPLIENVSSSISDTIEETTSFLYQTSTIANSSNSGSISSSDSLIVMSSPEIGSSSDLLSSSSPSIIVTPDAVRGLEIGIGLLIFVIICIAIILLVIGLVLVRVNHKRKKKNISYIPETSMVTFDEKLSTVDVMNNNPRFSNHNNDQVFAYCGDNEEFEMTNNPFYMGNSNCFDDSTSEFVNSECYSEGNNFQETENSAYERSCASTTNLWKANGDSNSNHRRFEIVSERRGDIMEKVDLVFNNNK